MDGDLYRCTGGSDQNHTQEKEAKWKKAKCLSEEVLQIAEKRKEKAKEKRKDKKAFLTDQCKEIEENNRMEKTRDFFKKIKDTKGNISYKDGHNRGQ